MFKGKFMILEILSIIFVPGVMTLYIAIALRKFAKKVSFRKKFVAIPSEGWYTE